MSGYPTNGPRRGATIICRPPKIGQHSVEILEEIGYPADQVRALIERAVIVDGRLT